MNLTTPFRRQCHASDSTYLSQNRWRQDCCYAASCIHGRHQRGDGGNCVTMSCSSHPSAPTSQNIRSYIVPSCSKYVCYLLLYMWHKTSEFTCVLIRSYLCHLLRAHVTLLYNSVISHCHVEHCWFLRCCMVQLLLQNGASRQWLESMKRQRFRPHPAMRKTGLDISHS